VRASGGVRPWKSRHFWAFKWLRASEKREKPAQWQKSYNNVKFCLLLQGIQKNFSCGTCGKKFENKVGAALIATVW
jgi:hypothetical protein